MITQNHRNAFFMGTAMLFRGWPRGFVEHQVHMWDQGVRESLSTPLETRVMIVDWQNGVRPVLLACETPQWMEMAEAASIAI